MNKLRKAKVNGTKIVIEVYRLVNGKLCDYANCTTEYKESDLTFI